MEWNRPLAILLIALGIITIAGVYRQAAVGAYQQLSKSPFSVGASRVGSATSGRLFSGDVTRHYAGSVTLAPDARGSADPQLMATSGAQRFVNKYPSGCQSEKWGVVTTIFKPSAAMEKVAALPGWCLVIVADKKTPDELYTQGLAEATDHVVYLSAKVQEEMAAGGVCWVSLYPGCLGITFLAKTWAFCSPLDTELS